jgi:hypothetical protein
MEISTCYVQFSVGLYSLWVNQSGNIQSVLNCSFTAPRGEHEHTGSCGPTLSTPASYSGGQASSLSLKTANSDPFSVQDFRQVTYSYGDFLSLLLVSLSSRFIFFIYYV